MGYPQCKANRELERIVPVVYGAVYSFAFYVISLLIFNFLERIYYQKDGTVPIDDAYEWTIFIKKSSIYLLITLYMIMDIGSVLKLSGKYPYRKQSRYIHEIGIAFLYVSAYLFLEKSILVSLLSFGLIITWGGIWCNELKVEYKTDESRIAEYMKTMRDLHYLFGSIFVIEAIAFFFRNGSMMITAKSLICFILTYLLWISLYIFIPVLKHGEGIYQVSLNFIIPFNFIKKASKITPFNFETEDDPTQK